jgi:hypothetical protein
MLNNFRENRVGVGDLNLLPPERKFLHNRYGL